MNTDFDFTNKYLFGPVVFRPEFNNFESIDTNQAWSLFFTTGQEDKALGSNSEAGKFFTNLLIAIGLASIFGAVIFTRIA